MKIAIYNHKGGVGKTMLSRELSQILDMQIIELDPYGHLSSLLPNAKKLSLQEALPSLKNTIYDFGGFADNRIKALDADLIIIPTIPTIISLQATIESFLAVKDFCQNILFILNCAINENDVAQAIDFLQENLNQEINCFVVPHTRALQTSENSCKSILEVANANPLSKHTYKKITSTFNELKTIIQTLKETK